MHQLRKSIYLQVTGFYIEINFKKTIWHFLKEKIQKDICDYCENFILVKKPSKIDFSIDFTDTKITDCIFLKDGHSNYLKVFIERENNKIQTYYSISIAEFQVILRKILLDLLVINKGFLLHASASDISGKAVLFLGPSGAGKTTIINLLRPRHEPLADDTIAIREEKGGFYFYQLPFYEKELNINKRTERFKIDKVFLLRKANFMKIIKINRKNTIFNQIFKQLLTVKPYLRIQSKHLLHFSMKSHFYYLFFLKDNKISNFLDKLSHLLSLSTTPTTPTSKKTSINVRTIK